MRLRVCVLSLMLAMLSIAFACDVNAEERILAYDVVAELQKDSSLRMTERIRVNIEHEAIRHGIYRVYPTRRRLENGKPKRHEFDIEAVTLDGKRVPYSRSAKGAHTAIAIGSEQ